MRQPSRMPQLGQGGRGVARRSTATSCRSTSSSAFLEADDRPSRTIQPQTRTKIHQKCRTIPYCSITSCSMLHHCILPLLTLCRVYTSRSRTICSLWYRYVNEAFDIRLVAGKRSLWFCSASRAPGYSGSRRRISASDCSIASNREVPDLDSALPPDLREKIEPLRPLIAAAGGLTSLPKPPRPPGRRP